MASMSSITAAMEAAGQGQGQQGDQELPPSVLVNNAGSSRANPNGVHHYQGQRHGQGQGQDQGQSQSQGPIITLDYGSGVHPCYGYYFLTDDEDEEENEPNFARDPQKYNELMINLALMVKAMRRMGVFEDEDDLDKGPRNYEDEMDSVVPDCHPEVNGSLTSGTGLSTGGSEGVENLGILLGHFRHPPSSLGGVMKKVGIPAKKKKTVRFQYDPKYDDNIVADETDHLVPELNEDFYYDNYDPRQAMQMGSGQGQGQDEGQGGVGQDQNENRFQ